LKATLSLNKQEVINIFLFIVISEICLMGGGRLVDIGPLSLRMLLFLLAQLYAITVLFKKKLDIQSITLLLYFIASLLLSAVIGIFNGADLSMVLNDIKPLSYFLMLLFFRAIIDSQQKVMLVIKTIKLCSVVLMVGYFILLLVIYFGLIDFKLFYERISETGEVFFRPGVGFFFKGFLFLCIGFLFYLFDGNKTSKIVAVLLLLAIVLTFTRGLILATMSCLIIYLLFFARKNIKTLLNIIILTVLVILLTPWFLTQLGDKTESNLPRIIAFEQVNDAMTSFSILAGHGLGIGVAEREDHMEASFLEIFHKQGVLGLLFWFFIFALIMKSYSEIQIKENKDIALPFVLSIVLIYIQTATNPYLNNPIGMSMVLITLSVLKILGDKKHA